MSELEIAYYEGLEQGQLLVQRCDSCHEHVMYPRYRCPFCQESALSWVRASGNGTLRTMTVMRAGPPSGYEDQLPYALGVVELEEGAQLLGRLHADSQGSWDSYVIDGPVEFQPVGEEEARSQPIAWFGTTA
jgi:Predicted nucleic-acid-binding protein containing a Zn-ribbon